MGDTACTGILTHVLFWTTNRTELIQYNCDQRDQIVDDEEVVTLSEVGEVFHVLDCDGDHLILPIVSGDESRDDVVIQDSLSDNAAGSLRAFAGDSGYFQTLELPALLLALESGEQNYTVVNPSTSQVYEREIHVSCGSEVLTHYIEIVNAGEARYDLDGNSANVAAYRIYRGALAQFGLEDLYAQSCNVAEPQTNNASMVSSD